jgi:glycosyltransferase involved in cell wall biosynthesis
MEEKRPFFSIIIPTYGRPSQLSACLQSITLLNYPHDRFEVIVVDDGSKTSPEAVVASFQDRLDVTLLAQIHSGPAAARNTGAARAKGNFLAFIDDDCAPAINWLQALAARFVTAPEHAIAGRAINALPYNLYSTASQILIDYLYDYYNADHDQPRFFTSNNLAIRLDQFHAVGEFDPSFTLAGAEDRELCDRWLYHDYPMIYAPEVLVYHAHVLTLQTFWRQHFTYGRGAFRFHQVRAKRSQQRIRLEPLSFYLNLLRYPSFRGQGWRTLSIAALLVLSQGANLAGLVWEGINRKRDS